MRSKTLKKATKLFKAGKYSKVLLLLESQVFRYRQSFDFFYLLGISCLRSSDYGGGYSYLQRAINIKPDDINTLAGLAVVRGAGVADRRRMISQAMPRQTSYSGFQCRFSNQLAKLARVVVRLDGNSQQRQARRFKRPVDKLVAFLTVRSLVRTVVQLNAQHRCERLPLAQYKVDVFRQNLTNPRSAISRIRLDPQQIRDSYHCENLPVVQNRLAQTAIEPQFRLGDQPLATAVRHPPWPGIHAYQQNQSRDHQGKYPERPGRNEYVDDGFHDDPG